jgi:hypothetical protein
MLVRADLGDEPSNGKELRNSMQWLLDGSLNENVTMSRSANPMPHPSASHIHIIWMFSVPILQIFQLSHPQRFVHA